MSVAGADSSRPHPEPMTAAAAAGTGSPGTGTARAETGAAVTTAAASAVADRMADAASAVLASLDDAGRSRVAPGWSPESDPESEEERRRWFYTPTDHGGLTVGAMTPRQYQRTMALVATGLSEAGYVTAATIMGLENVLDRVEEYRVLFDRERGRDPGMYYLRIFGTPGDPMWGWRFGGHHVSLNNLVVSGALASCTPCFLGADPARSPLLGSRELRPLGGVEDVARELLRSLNPSLRTRAVLTSRAPVDIASANRPRVAPGDRVLPLRSLFRGRFTDPALAERMEVMHRTNEERYGITRADHDAVELTAEPRGVPASELDAGQRELLRALLDCYLGRAPAEVAEQHAEKYAGTRLDQVHFAWAGSAEPGEACYYRLQGPRLLVEYDNAQRLANHAHSVWRDPEGDFGADVLAAHRAVHHGA
jgi:Protein of unknown function (DUF3500)